MTAQKIKFAYFGSKDVSGYVLDELKAQGYEPDLVVSSARDPLPLETLRTMEADVFIVASFGKILPKEVISMPRRGTLNIHPSLLPRLRGPSPIRSAILNEDRTGVTVIAMDEKMDHGPILAQEELNFEIWPDRHSVIEKRLWTEGGRLLAKVLTDWVEGRLKPEPQDDSRATFTHFLTKADADITNDPPERAWRKILAFEGWPRARRGDLIITGAHLEDGALVIDRVIPPGKREMDYRDYLRGKR